MNIAEFTKYTGFYPSYDLFEVIKKTYKEQFIDIDEFCKAYKENKDGIAERIQNIANRNMDIIKADNLMLQGSVKDLEVLLENAQRWKRYEDPRNVSQKAYNDLEFHANGKICARYMSDEEAINLITNKFDINPESITIVHDIPTFEVNYNNHLRCTGNMINRRPILFNDAYYYIRFNTTHAKYEAYCNNLSLFYEGSFYE